MVIATALTVALHSTSPRLRRIGEVECPPKLYAKEDLLSHMYYVYILKSENSNQTYTGYTTDLEKRFKDHNSGKAIHSNKFRPWKLIAYSGFETENKAREFERYLKTGSGIAFARKHFL